jgi:REP element-mobilizing transposase RayT
MPKSKRVCPAGEVFHVLNRAVARLTIFEKPEDYDAFLRVLDETWLEVPLPVFAMVAMPNHLKALRNCVRGSRPYGDDAWTKSSVARLGLETTVRSRGRPMRLPMTQNGSGVICRNGRKGASHK